MNMDFRDDIVWF